MRAIPLEDRLICRVLEPKDPRVCGGKKSIIEIPDTARGESTGVYLEVLAAGPGQLLEESYTTYKTPPHAFKVGDVVCASKHAGLDMVLDGEKVRVVNFPDVYFVVGEKIPDGTG